MEEQGLVRGAKTDELCLKLVEFEAPVGIQVKRYTVVGNCTSGENSGQEKMSACRDGC